MADRFYLPGPWDQRCELAGSEAHHLLHVLRVKPGAEIELFDGCGRSARAVVESVARHAAQLQLLAPPVDDPPRTAELALAVAAPKGDRLKWMVEKLTELGVDRFIPLKTRRTVVTPGEVKLHKLEQTIVSACKQCGRNMLLGVDDLCDLNQLGERFESPAPRLYFGDRSGQPLSTTAAPAGDLLVVIGPEGGLTDEETDWLRSRGAAPISLGRNTLRVETAAVAAAAILKNASRHG